MSELQSIASFKSGQTDQSPTSGRSISLKKDGGNLLSDFRKDKKNENIFSSKGATNGSFTKQEADMAITEVFRFSGDVEEETMRNLLTISDNSLKIMLGLHLVQSNSQ